MDTFPKKLFGLSTGEEGVQRKERIGTLSAYLVGIHVVLDKFLGSGSNKSTFQVSAECLAEEFPSGCVAKICKHTETNDMEQKVYERCERRLGDRNFLTKTLFHRVGGFTIQLQECCDTTDQEAYCYEPCSTETPDKKDTKARMEECRDRDLDIVDLATSINVKVKDFTKENIMRTKATNVWKVSDFEFDLVADDKKFDPYTWKSENMHLGTEIMANCVKEIKLKRRQDKAAKTIRAAARRSKRGRRIPRKLRITRNSQAVTSGVPEETQDTQQTVDRPFVCDDGLLQRLAAQMTLKEEP